MTNTKEDFEFVATLFSSCTDTHGVKELIFDWMTKIKNGTYKDAVEEVRTLFANGNDAAASEKKRMLPAIAPAGYLPEGRTESDPIMLSRVGMIDIDKHDAKWSAIARDSLKGKKGIIGCYITIRGGLRIFVYLPKLTRELYTFYMRVVFDYIDNLLGYPHDDQVKTVTHLCSASYDPDAWCVTPEEVTEFPVIEHLTAMQRKSYQMADGEIPFEDEEDKQTDDEECSLEDEFNESYRIALEHQRPEYSKAKLDDLLTRFLGRCPLVKGARSNNLVRLGQYLHYMRCKRNELEYFIKASQRIINDREFNEKNVRQAICWGFTHNSGDQCQTRFAKQWLDDLSDSENGRNVQNVQNIHSKECFESENEQETDFQQHFNKTVKDSCPFFPEMIYDNIPEFFKPLIVKTGNRRDTDNSFMAALATVSAAMPNVTVQVRQKNYSTNGYFCLVGPAASGKGMITMAPMLLDGIQKRLDEENDTRIVEYQNKNLRWDLERKQANNESRIANRELYPGDEPEEKLLVAEPHTSRSKLISSLAANPHGLFMFASELNTINESLHSDCGHHNAELAGIAMNEKQGFNYKNSRRKITVEFPKLSILTSGTPPQYVTFVGNTHEGMESRVYTLLTTSQSEWISWADEKEGELDKIMQSYKQASEKLVAIYDFLKEHPTHVTIPVELRRKCDNYCSYYLSRLVEEGYSNLDSVVKRCPILISRICAIFCALRKYDMGSLAVEMVATPEDVETALKIALTFLRHTCIATTMLLKQSRKANNLKNVFKREDLYLQLSDKFTIADMTKLCVDSFQYSESSIRRILKDWINDGYLERVKRGFYRKTDKVFL